MRERPYQIIGRLESRGYEAFAVGGCVRDTLLGREPGDWDITTSASPQQVKAVFKRTIDTGILHGTVTVMKGHVGYEVTTYRIDGEYEDGRHPKSVQFTSDLKEDLRRRDFTINAVRGGRPADPAGDPVFRPAGLPDPGADLGGDPGDGPCHR